MKKERGKDVSSIAWPLAILMDTPLFTAYHGTVYICQKCDNIRTLGAIFGNKYGD
jgi:hypothetical protein